jgi:circadian clock protein KaiC
MLFRYFEMKGEVRVVMSVMKKRSGYHERTIRTLEMDGKGIHVGEPLRSLSGILTGVPRADE